MKNINPFYFLNTSRFTSPNRMKKNCIDFDFGYKVLTYLAKNLAINKVESFGCGEDCFRWYEFDASAFCGEIITIEIDSLFRAEECARFRLFYELCRIMYGDEFEHPMTFLEFSLVQKNLENKAIENTGSWSDLVMTGKV